MTFGDPDFLNGPRHAPGGGPGAPRRVPERDLRLHRQGRAPAAPARAPAGAGRARLRVRRLRGGVAQTTRARAISTRATRAPTSWPRSAPTREAGIALRPTWVAFTPWTTLDDYRAVARLPGRRRRWWTTWTPCSTRSACWCRRARCCSSCPRCARTSARWCGRRSPTGGRTPIRGWTRLAEEVAGGRGGRRPSAHEDAGLDVRPGAARSPRRPPAPRPPEPLRPAGPAGPGRRGSPSRGSAERSPPRASWPCPWPERGIS